MAVNPGCQLRETRNRLGLELQRLRVLFLAAGTLKIHDQFPRDPQRDLLAIIFLDERKGQVDASCSASRCVELSVFNKDGIVINFKIGKATRDVMGVVPMGRDFASGKKARCGQTINSRANRCDATRRSGPRLCECRNRSVNDRFANSTSAWNDESVQGRSGFESPLRFECQPGLRYEWLA